MGCSESADAKPAAKPTAAPQPPPPPQPPPAAAASAAAGSAENVVPESNLTATTAPVAPADKELFEPPHSSYAQDGGEPRLAARLHELRDAKDAAVKGGDFDRAAQLRDDLDTLCVQRRGSIERLQQDAEQAGRAEEAAFLRKVLEDLPMAQSRTFRRKPDGSGTPPADESRLRMLEQQVQMLNQEKQRAVADGDFDRAASLRDEVASLRLSPQSMRAATSRGMGMSTSMGASVSMVNPNNRVYTVRDNQAAATFREDTGWRKDFAQGGGGRNFLGRCTLSLDFLVRGSAPTKTATLPLDVELGCVGELGSVPPMLTVSVYAMRQRGKVGHADPFALGTEGNNFIVHVMSASGIPPTFGGTVFCEYCFAWGGGPYRSPEAHNTTEPAFDYKKRFGLPPITEQFRDVMMEPDCVVFEVVGLGAMAQ